MSSGQSGLGEYGVSVPAPESDTDTDQPDRAPKLGFESVPASPSLPADVAAARSVDWVVFTGRYPYVFDAARLGFAIGHREDSSYQWTPNEVNLPVHFLDNDYQDSDLERFVRRVHEYQPEIAVLGDIYRQDDLPAHLEAAEEIWETHPYMELVLVPKCADVLGEIPSEFILGYANGASPIQATDIASHREWRTVDNRLHILGGTPLATFDEIVALTQDWVTGEPPADIAGIDWNGYQRYAENRGDYAAADGGWHRNLRDQYPPKRDLIRYSLLNAKHFWISKGVWPGERVEDLPVRSELLNANRKGPTAISRDAQTDCLELLLSPQPTSNRHKMPIYRTDNTQAAIIEPLSPLATVLGTDEWAPDGEVNTRMRYALPQLHRTEPTCTGCGRPITTNPNTSMAGDCLDNRGRRERRRGGVGPSGAPHFQIVSYEHHDASTTNDFESVATDGPDTLTSERRFPRIHTFCSTTCRTRTEGRSPELLLGDIQQKSGPAPCYPDGELIAKVEG
jgi:hypothetical protein